VVHLDADAVHLGQQLGVEHLGRRPVAADPALVEQHQLVGHRGGLVEVVQHQPDRHAAGLGEVADEVEQQHGGVLRQAAGQPDPLQLAARELVDRPVAQVADPGQGHGVGDRGRPAGVDLAPAAAVRVPAEPDDVAHRQPGRGGAALRQQGHLARELASAQGERVDAVARGFEPQVAGDRPVQPRERAQQGRLAAAVG
jgi:hypothetical protein